MTTAVYAGTFDPFTYGHLSVLTQACRIFSHVRILVAVNKAKTPLFSEHERVDIIHSYVAKMPNVSVDFAPGYVARYAEEIGAAFLVRGVRNLTDAAAELNLAEQNKEVAPHIQTVLLPADPALSDVSSSGVKLLVSSSVNEDPYSLMSRSRHANINPYTHSALIKSKRPIGEPND